MSIEWFKKRMYEKKVLSQQKSLDIGDVYEKMKTAIEQIYNTDGFREIVGYFEREVALHESRLQELNEAMLLGKKIDQVHLNTVIASSQSAKKFLSFLVNILSN